MKNHRVEYSERNRMVHPSSRLLRPSRDQLIHQLFQLMSKHQRDVGDWELRRFTQDHPKCVNWKHPQKEMVPLLYAFYLNSRWLVRHFIQMDQAKIHKKDKWGRDVCEIVSDTGQSDLLTYAMVMLSDDPPDVYKYPLTLEDPLKGVPKGINHVLEANRRLNEVLAQQAKERDEHEENSNVVFVSPVPGLNNDLD